VGEKKSFENIELELSNEVREIMEKQADPGGGCTKGYRACRGWRK
jgi:hypothetical protein